MEIETHIKNKKNQEKYFCFDVLVSGVKES